MKKLLSFLIIILAFISISCNTQKKITMIAKNKYDSISIKKNDTLSIELVSNPSTGYKWVFDNLDSSAFKLLDEQFVSPKTNLIGTAGKQIFTLKALKKGSFNLHLNYVRLDSEPEKEYTLNVNVK